MSRSRRAGPMAVRTRPTDRPPTTQKYMRRSTQVYSVPPVLRPRDRRIRTFFDAGSSHPRLAEKAPPWNNGPDDTVRILVRLSLLPPPSPSVLTARPLPMAARITPQTALALTRHSSEALSIQTPCRIHPPRGGHQHTSTSGIHQHTTSDTVRGSLA